MSISNGPYARMSKLLPTHPVKTMRFCYDGRVFCNIALMKPKILLFATLILGSVACTDKAYDPDRMSMEMTFFENEISVPVGSVGPLTVQSLAGKILENIGFGSDEDGYLTANFSKDFFTKSAYEIALKAPDPSQPLSMTAAASPSLSAVRRRLFRLSAWV